MAIINPDGFSAISARFPSVANNTFAATQSDALNVGSQLAAGAMQIAGQKQLQDELFAENALIRKEARKQDRFQNALLLLGGLGAVRSPGRSDSGNRMASIPPEVIANLFDPAAPLRSANSVLQEMNAFRAGTLPWGAGGAGTAASALRIGGAA